MPAEILHVFTQPHGIAVSISTALLGFPEDKTHVLISWYPGLPIPEIGAWQEFKA
jgi:hypothetical protein